MGKFAGIIGAVAGAVLSFFIPPLGFLAGASWGMAIGGLIGSIIDPPDQPSIGDPARQEFQLNTSKEGGAVGTYLGTVKVKNANWLTYGLFNNSPITKEVESGGKGGSSSQVVTTGYKYFMSGVLGLGDGSFAPCLHLLAVYADDNLVWSGDLEAGAEGETIVLKNEIGTMRFYPGLPDQPEDPIWQRIQADSKHYPYKNRIMAVMDNIFIGGYNRSPSFSFIITCMPPVPWSSDIGMIDTYNYNPAFAWYIITRYMLRMSEDSFDEVAFAKTAADIEIESHGISLAIDAFTTANEVLSRIESHVGMIVPISSEGKLSPFLLRDDNEQAVIPSYTNDDVKGSPQITRNSVDGSPNIVSIQYNEFSLPPLYPPILFSGGGTGGQKMNNYTNQINENLIIETKIPALFGEIRRIFTGSGTTFIIDSLGSLWVIGENGNGQAGLGYESSAITVLTKVIDGGCSFVSVGDFHSALIKTDDTLWTCGKNIIGELGTGDEIDKNVFTHVKIDKTFTHVSCGWIGTMAVSTERYLWATGHTTSAGHRFGWEDQDTGAPDPALTSNVFKQCGSPVNGTLLGWSRISLGYEVAVGIKGKLLMGCGVSNYGEGCFGVGVVSIFTESTVGYEWVDVKVIPDSTREHTVALLGNSHVYTAGYNGSGQLGQGDTVNRSDLTFVLDLENKDIVQIEATLDTSYALASDGSFHQCGYKLDQVTTINEFEEIYANTGEFETSPVTYYKYTSFAAEDAYIFALRQEPQASTKDPGFILSTSNPNSEDRASIEIQDKKTKRTMKYGMFTMNKDAVWAADRLLRGLSWPGLAGNFKFTRSGFNLIKGDKFDFDIQAIGVKRFRADSVSEAEINSGLITVKASEVNPFPVVTEAAPGIDPDIPVAPELLDIVDPLVQEIPYRMAGNLISIIPLVSRVNAASIGYNIYYSSNGTSYVQVGSGTKFPARGELLTAYSQDTVQIDIFSEGFQVEFEFEDEVTNIESISIDLVGENNNLAVIISADRLQSEIITFATFTPEVAERTYTITDIYRGRFDTNRIDHLAGSTFFFLGSTPTHVEYNNFEKGVEAYFKFVPFSSSEILSTATAEVATHDIVGRALTPYAPQIEPTDGFPFVEPVIALEDNQIQVTWHPRVRGIGAGYGNINTATDAATQWEGKFDVQIYDKTETTLLGEAVDVDAISVVIENITEIELLTKVRNYLIGDFNVRYTSLYKTYINKVDPPYPWKKLIVTDSLANKLYCEVEFWDSDTEKAIIHIKIPTISDSVDTVVNISFDPANPDNSDYISFVGGTPAVNVWDSNFVLVSHLSNSPDSTGSLLDSTSNNNNGDPEGSVTALSLVDTDIGKAIDLNGSNDYLNFGNDSVFNINDELTLESVFIPNFTFNSTSIDQFKGLISHQRFPDVIDSYAILINPDGKLHLGSTGGSIQSTQAEWLINTLYCVSATYKNTGLVGTMYVDGSLETLSFDGLNTMDTDINDLVIGFHGSEYIDGRMSNIRVSDIVRSASWLETTPKTIKDELAENSVPSALAFTHTIPAASISVTLTDFPIALSINATAGTTNTDLTPVFDELG